MEWYIWIGIVLLIIIIGISLRKKSDESFLTTLKRNTIGCGKTR